MRLLRLVLLVPTLAMLSPSGCGGGTVTPDAGLCDGAPCMAPCTRDPECPVTAPRCETDKGRCVPCLPTDDNCGPGRHCVAMNGTYECTSMCRNAADCAKDDMGGMIECCGSACLDLFSDKKNCGACGKVCAPPANAAASCTRGVCGLGACTDGFADCDKDDTNGCEAALATDAKNCGACGTSCAMLPNANGACVAGACKVSSCTSGFDDCDGDPKNGCEVDLTGDVDNCGSCKHMCPVPANAAPACQMGQCGLGPCKQEFVDCDRNPDTGCEVGVADDIHNCGACGNQCSFSHAGAMCVAGKCALGSCDAGFGDCNVDPMDGCEIDLLTNLKFCGACNAMPCPQIAHGAPGCKQGMCAIDSCDAGFDDCDANGNNGCEADLNSVATCGACKNMCSMPANATPACNGMMCGIGMCDPLFGDCNGDPMDGCERPLAGDANNCGACGKVCSLDNANAGCQAGACTIASCKASFNDCDGDPKNGCESDSRVDAKNCGACNKPCAMGRACANGMCQACNVNVLVLGDNQAATDQQFVNALNNAGMSAQLIANGGINYTGAPDAATFGAVVIFTGDNYSTDMPLAGQQSVLNAANATTGVVITEWAAYQWENARWVTLKPLQLILRTSGDTKMVTYTLESPNHPIWTGLPNSFTTLSSLGFNVGATLLNGGARIAGCAPGNSAGVAVRDNGKGRVVQIADAPGYSSSAQGATIWNDANRLKLQINAVKWAASCM